MGVVTMYRNDGKSRIDPSSIGVNLSFHTKKNASITKNVNALINKYKGL